jgi:uncharacterized protein (TIGR03435 family)
MRHVICKVVLVVAATAIAVMPVPAQAPAQKPQFEVASVKPNKLGGPPVRMGTEGGRFIAENYPLILVLLFAYRSPAGTYLLREHVIGGPSWIDSDRFDIEAKVEGGSRGVSSEQMLRMVQSLLQDRFQLRVHRETRQLPVYNLVIAKSGVKMKLAADQSLPHSDDEDDQPGKEPSGLIRGETAVAYTPSGEMVLEGMAVPVTPNSTIRRSHSLPPRSLTTLLQGSLGRPVIDKTGLKGLFDFRFQFVRQALSPNPDVSGPSIFTAIEEQLGLKLESAKGPVEVLVIDHVERPSEN